MFRGPDNHPFSLVFSHHLSVVWYSFLLEYRSPVATPSPPVLPDHFDEPSIHQTINQILNQSMNQSMCMCVCMCMCLCVCVFMCQLSASFYILPLSSAAGCS